MHKPTAGILFAAMIASLLASCYSPYLAKPVNTDHPAVCAINALPAACTLEDANFIFRYSIDETAVPNGYVVDATATFHGSITWNYYKNAVFTLLLVKEGVVVDTVSASRSRGSLAEGIHFQRHFTTPSPFDGVAFSYVVRAMTIGEWHTTTTLTPCASGDCRFYGEP